MTECLRCHADELLERAGYAEQVARRAGGFALACPCVVAWRYAVAGVEFAQLPLTVFGVLGLLLACGAFVRARSLRSEAGRLLLGAVLDQPRTYRTRADCPH